MSSYRIRIGKEAELLAASELKKRGYDIIETNYHCRGGEIDIIARDGEYLVFVEVRCKTTERFGTPAESVNERKQRKIITAARCYLNTLPNAEVLCRFDVVEVISCGNTLTIKSIIRDAFIEED